MDRKQQDAKEGAGYAAHKYEKWAVRPSLPVFRAMSPSSLLLVPHTARGASDLATPGVPMP